MGDEARIELVVNGRPAVVAAGRSDTLLDLLRDRLGLTGRGWDRVRRVARTIADLEGTGIVAGDHVAEAMTLRGAA